MKRNYRIAVAKGDGIGPEVVGSAVSVLEAAAGNAGLAENLELHYVTVGWDSYHAYGRPLTGGTLNDIGSSDCLILGPLEVGKYPEDAGTLSPSGAIRRHFDLYANLRPVKTYVRSVQKPIDVQIVRENTVWFYADRNLFAGYGEYMPTRDLAMSVRVITREKSSKISRIAFEESLKRRKKVTAVHKGNVLRVTDGLFLEEFRREAKNFSEVHSEDRIVDSMAYDLVLNPESFDVIVTTNMYGDILSDEAAAIAGSLGVAPAINYGDAFGMAQAAHGTANAIAGTGRANPISEILSISMLLDWLMKRHGDDALGKVSRRIKDAVESVLKEPWNLTEDLGGDGDLQSVTDLIESVL